MSKKEIRNLVTELSLTLCFFADRAKQERECKQKRRYDVYYRAMCEFLDSWDEVKEERKGLWTWKYREIESFAEIVTDSGKKMFDAQQEGNPLHLESHPDWLAIQKRALGLVGGHNLHEELA